MDCVNCATPIPQDAKFCHNCGSQVSDAEGQAKITQQMDSSSFAHMEKLLREEAEGEFEIEGLLGRGGMAVVYLATEVHLARKVAIKVLPPELTFGHGVERFKREAKTAAALDHPHIIPIYRIASEGTLFWYAMKFLEGRALDEILRERGRLPLDETIEILEQVADALDYAHDKSVIHRDIKPANIMLDHRNRVIVTDFGIAKALTEQNLTASGSVVGTPYYMSPEQGMGKKITGAADQYSVAVMAYRMLSGQIPFEGDSAIDILHKHCMIPPPPLEVIQSGLPKYVYKAVHKALEKKAENRFQSVTAFVKALESPTPETDSYPDISSSEMATVALQGTGGGASAASSEAATQITPRTGQVLRISTEIIDTKGAKIGTPRKEKSSAGKLIGIGAVLAVIAAGGFGVTQMLGGRDEGSQPPIRQAETPIQTAQGPAEQPPAAPVPTTGTVQVAAPPGATILVDGQRQSSSAFDLAAGSYQLEIRVAGYQPQQQTVTVIAGQGLSIPFMAQRIQTLATPPPQQRQPVQAQSQRPPPAVQPRTPAVTTGKILIQASPVAEILVDGLSLGEKRQIEHEVPAGQHTVTLRREGYVTQDTTITVIAGETRRVRIRLQKAN